MSAEARLADIVAALEEAGLLYLVMGGHAARYYGLDRNTIDYDLHLPLEKWDQLPARLQQAKLFAGLPLIEGASWRPHDFRRFLIGRLPDGREEWLEFWRANHLLAPFPELYGRREVGLYGGRTMPFVGLADLIHSKETERETDWQDIALLEEIQDGRNLAKAADHLRVVNSLSCLRSRRGFERAVAQGHLADIQTIAEALSQANSPMARAYLTPYVPQRPISSADSGMIGEILAGPLGRVTPASLRHLALVEAVRRLYKQAAVAADREDKIGAIRS